MERQAPSPVRRTPIISSDESRRLSGSEIEEPLSITIGWNGQEEKIELTSKQKQRAMIHASD
ncbi:hypothetical protein ABEV00_13045 [Paenibacillus thiaminolyticus]|uniref:hypothetical protein n=1 Tax=Paenibacillus TaxID=44249 RepID=UPI001059AD87|nr:hypothetical protein [Paenibacillus dendritiformis]TDL57043.1 hypothetical protein E2R60_00480 [Paenibacillus dendritiformis]